MNYKVNLSFDYDADAFMCDLDDHEKLLWLYLAYDALQGYTGSCGCSDGIFTNVRTMARFFHVDYPDETIATLVKMGALIPMDSED